MRTLNKGPLPHTVPACGQRTFWHILCGCPQRPTFAPDLHREPLIFAGSPDPHRKSSCSGSPEGAKAFLTHRKLTQACHTKRRVLRLPKSSCPLTLPCWTLSASPPAPRLQCAPGNLPALGPHLPPASQGEVPPAPKALGEPLLLCSSQPATQRAGAQPLPVGMPVSLSGSPPVPQGPGQESTWSPVCQMSKHLSYKSS